MPDGKNYVWISNNMERDLFCARLVLGGQAAVTPLLLLLAVIVDCAQHRVVQEP